MNYIFSTIYPNSKKYFDEFINSINAQTYKNFKIFLVLNGTSLSRKQKNNHQQPNPLKAQNLYCAVCGSSFCKSSFQLLSFNFNDILAVTKFFVNKSLTYCI